MSRRGRLPCVHGYTVIHTPFNTPYEKTRVELYYKGILLSVQKIEPTELPMSEQQECWFIDYHKDDFWFYMVCDYDTGRIHKHLVKNNASQDNKDEITLKRVRWIEIPPE